MKSKVNFIHLLTIWLTFSLTFSSPLYGEENEGLEVLNSLRSEAKQAALSETQILMARLRRIIQAERPSIDLNYKLSGIATEIFFSVSLNLEIDLRINKYFKKPLRSPPQIIVVSSRARAGNTTLIQFISKALSNDPSQVERVSLVNELQASPENLVRRSKGKRILILDDFSFYFDFAGIGLGNQLIPLLMAEADSEIIFVIDTSEAVKRLNSAALARIQSIVGEGARKDTCSEMLTTFKNGSNI